jgi:hypothetical protein
VPEGIFFALEIDGVKFGRLSKSLCSRLHELLAAAKVQILAYVALADWQAGRRVGYGLLPLEINFYGAQADAKEIGSISSRLGLFLQYPRFGMDTRSYWNPHILHIEGYVERPLRGSPADTLVDTPPQHRSGAEVSAVPQESDTEVVESILDSLSHHSLLREITSILGIKSRLLA